MVFSVPLELLQVLSLASILLLFPVVPFRVVPFAGSCVIVGGSHSCISPWRAHPGGKKQEKRQTGEKKRETEGRGNERHATIETAIRRGRYSEMQRDTRQHTKGESKQWTSGAAQMLDVTVLATFALSHFLSRARTGTPSLAHTLFSLLRRRALYKPT